MTTPREAPPIVRSVNPLLPSNEFIPDGEPRVFGDRVYLYGSHDLAGGGMCGGDYVCYSAPLDDLAAWRYDGVIFRQQDDPFIASRGGTNRMTERLFAPDVLLIDGRYYLYYGVGLTRTGFGVAVADAPTGPFEYVGRVRYPDSEKPAGWKDDRDGIADGDLAFGLGKSPFRGFREYPYDPALIEHEGRLFLYFGMLNCSVVELDPADKRTVIRNADTGLFITPILRSSILGFVRARISGSKRKTVMLNGPSIREVDGRFVLSYWAMGGQGFSGMHYAVADRPSGPFTPSGPLVALGNAWKDGQIGATDRVGNTHGGMFEVEGTWYQIYHRHTADGRQACGTALTRRADGSFEQSDYDSLGLDPRPLDAFRAWPAYLACHLTGTSKRTRPALSLRDHPAGDVDPDTGRRTRQVLTGTYDGGVAGYKFLDFGTEGGSSVFGLRIQPRSGGRVEVRLDDPAGPAVATVGVPADAVGRGWADLTAPASAVTGVHAVFLVFRPDRGELGDVDTFGFTASR
jgi:hypothetical protein